MAQAILISEKVVEALNDLQERLYAKHWNEHSRASFTYSLLNTINALNDIKTLLLESKTAFQNEGKNIPDISLHMTELEGILSTLGQNYKMEEARIRKAKEKGIEFLADDITTPELYSSLEQKVLGFILKTRFFVERLSLIERKENLGGLSPSKGTKKVLELLDEKEKEIHELKKKYEEIKNRHYMARIEEKTSHDIEKEFILIARKTEGEQKLLESAIESYRQALELLQQTYVPIREKFRSIEELNRQNWETTLELVSTLKKERDYAKKIVLDIENETMRLRNAYSKQILSIEEEKAHAKSDAIEEQRKKFASATKMISEKEDLIKNLKEILSAKDKHIEKMEKEIQKISHHKKPKKKE